MNEVNSTSKKSSGRRPGSNETKEGILRAASSLFARHGYDKTSLRQIAAVAEVDASLILHYFGSKNALFVASMTPLLEGPKRLPEAFEGDIDDVGERLATIFVGLIGNNQTREMMLGMFRSASSDVGAADALRQFVEGAIMKAIEEYLPGPHKKLQANLLGSQLIGVFMARYIVKIEPLASIDDRELIEYLAPRLQAHFSSLKLS